MWGCKCKCKVDIIMECQCFCLFCEMTILFLADVCTAATQAEDCLIDNAVCSDTTGGQCVCDTGFTGDAYTACSGRRFYCCFWVVFIQMNHRLSVTSETTILYSEKCCFGVVFIQMNHRLSVTWETTMFYSHKNKTIDSVIYRVVL